MQPKPCNRCAQMPYISPGFICHTEGCRWAITAEMIRPPNESEMAEKMDSEREAFEKWHRYSISIGTIDPSGVLFDTWKAACAWKTCNWGAHLAQPAQAVDVGAIRGVIDDLRDQEAEIARLSGINVRLCADFNAQNLHGAQLDDRVRKAEARADKAEALLRELLGSKWCTAGYRDVVRRITAHLGGEHE